MNFDLVKKNSAYKRFLSDVKSGKLSHAYIVFSEDDELREAFYKLAAISVFCKNACGECKTCQSILNDDYVEILKVNAQDKFGVRDMEDLNEKIMNNPVVGTRKIVVIDHAEKMSPIVQNKFLKTYEEPPEYLTVILMAATEGGLLGTIKSRGKKFYLDLLSAEDIRKELVEEGVDEQTAAVSASFALGNYTKALRYSVEDGYRKQYDRTFKVMCALKKSSQIPEFVGDEIFSKDNILLTLDFMEIILSDVMKLVTNAQVPLYNVDREYDLSEIKQGYLPESVSNALALVNEARIQLNANVSAYNVTGTLLFGILEAKYKWQKK